ncbi:transporter substrate-binding domain-containing protein [Ancylobacter sp. 6x-1]|uniref:Transporter substrate-binding domain-containing protein n=1 Tax=Ancylobacter crimeensis TaxID=2579147 RepID=A0ABT0DDZ7_9HYPH|nr:transporter substrate-binding domain-containing protein [Ancylobacter crimeensis]MCK0198196.1 transporter substrate-binding domain-containing protein [Ancylobacter crimeensis]
MTTKSRLAGAALLCAAFLPTTAFADKLVLGNEGSYPPFSITDAAGKLTGVEPELAREMCKRMNADCEIVAMDFKALIPAMLQNKLDAIATQIKPNAERKERALFSIPIVYNPDGFVVKAGAPDELTKENAKGMKFGQMRGTVQVKYLTETFGDAIEITPYDNPDQIRLDLLAGRIDATLGPRINWSIELLSKPEGKDFKFAGGEIWTGDQSIPVALRGSSWIVRKDSQPLLDRMNAALKSMIEDCTFTRIRAQFVPVAIVPAEQACADRKS